MRRLWLAVLTVVVSWGCGTATSEEAMHPRTPVPAPGSASVPEVARAPVLVASGFGQRGLDLSYALIAANPDPGARLEGARYTVQAYDREDHVLASASAALPVLRPAARLGVGGYLTLSADAAAVRVSIQLESGHLIPGAIDAVLTVQDATLRQDADQTAVRGLLVNNTPREVVRAAVSAVVYDADGTIVGGGIRYYPVSARGRLAITVPVVLAEGRTPARVELYPALTRRADSR